MTRNKGPVLCNRHVPNMLCLSNYNLDVLTLSTAQKNMGYMHCHLNRCTRAHVRSLYTENRGEIGYSMSALSVRFNCHRETIRRIIVNSFGDDLALDREVLQQADGRRSAELQASLDREDNTRNKRWFNMRRSRQKDERMLVCKNKGKARLVRSPALYRNSNSLTAG